jgi:hypothetical protein
MEHGEAIGFSSGNPWITGGISVGSPELARTGRPIKPPVNYRLEPLSSRPLFSVTRRISTAAAGCDRDRIQRVALASRENLLLKQTEELLQQNDCGPGHAEREMT